jgi:hypothetical protein
MRTNKKESDREVAECSSSSSQQKTTQHDKQVVMA